MVFWSEREKPLYLSPSGRTLTSRKAVLAAMEVIGGYSPVFENHIHTFIIDYDQNTIQDDYEKVKKAVGKRKKKSSNRWVPIKRKVRPKGPVGRRRRAEDEANSFVGYFDGPSLSKLRPCSVMLATLPLGEEEVKAAAESLAESSQSLEEVKTAVEILQDISEPVVEPSEEMP